MPLIYCEINIFLNLVWRIYYSNWRLWQGKTKIYNNCYKNLCFSGDFVNLDNEKLFIAEIKNRF